MFLQWIWTGGVVALWGIWGLRCQETMLEQLTADKNAAEKVPPAEWQNGRSEVETLECAENGSGTYGWCLGGKELVKHG